MEASVLPGSWTGGDRSKVGGDGDLRKKKNGGGGGGELQVFRVAKTSGSKEEQRFSSCV